MKRQKGNVKKTLKPLHCLFLFVLFLVLFGCTNIFMESLLNRKKGSFKDGLLFIPSGRFIMGSPLSEPDRSTNETQHPATVSAFSMSPYPVTQAQWTRVMGTTIHDQVAKASGILSGAGDNYPMYYVNWYEAVVFCNKLSMMKGLNPVYKMPGHGTDPADWEAAETMPTVWNASSLWNNIQMIGWPGSVPNGYRLPTEAEWEYACRGNYPNKATELNTKPFGIGNGTIMTMGMANFITRYAYALPLGNDDKGAGSPEELAWLNSTSLVGNYTPNNYGLFDMHGNVLEWCWDWYDPAYLLSPPPDYAGPGSPPPTSPYRVNRGGSWWSYGHNLRSARRGDADPFIRREFAGFRVVRG